MKIAQVANGFPPIDRGGVESYTYNFSQALIGAGHQVAVFCRDSGDTQPLYTSRDDMVDGIPVRFVVNWFAPYGAFARRYFDRYIERLFVDWLAEYKPDIIHFQHTYPLSASLLERVQAMKIPFVVTLHDFWYMCPQLNLLRPDFSLCPGSHHSVNCYECVFGHAYAPPGENVPNFTAGLPEKAPANAEPHPIGLSDSLYYPLQRLLPGWVRKLLLKTHDFLRLTVVVPLRSLWATMGNVDRTPLETRATYMQNLLQQCRYIIAPSRKVKEFYVDFGVPEDTIYVIPHGMNVAVWNNFKPVSRPLGETVRFGYIGSLLPHKGVDFLIKVFLTADLTDVELSIHGFEIPDTSFTRRLHNMARDSLVIHFAGPYSQPELPNILNEIDVLLIPSRVHESFSIVTREAMLAGLPVIASNVGGIPDAIQNEVNGILLPPGDMDAWQNALRRIATDPELIAELHKAQLQMAIHIKSINDHATEIGQIYNDIIS